MQERLSKKESKNELHDLEVKADHKVSFHLGNFITCIDAVNKHLLIIPHYTLVCRSRTSTQGFWGFG